MQTPPALSGSGAHRLETAGHLTHPLGFRSTLANPSTAHTLDFNASQSLYQEQTSRWLTASAGPAQARGATHLSLRSSLSDATPGSLEMRCYSVMSRNGCRAPGGWSLCQVGPRLDLLLCREAPLLGPLPGQSPAPSTDCGGPTAASRLLLESFSFITVLETCSDHWPHNSPIKRKGTSDRYCGPAEHSEILLIDSPMGFAQRVRMRFAESSVCRCSFHIGGERQACVSLKGRWTMGVSHCRTARQGCFVFSFAFCNRMSFICFVFCLFWRFGFAEPPSRLTCTHSSCLVDVLYAQGPVLFLFLPFCTLTKLRRWL